jgi:hypothetical protein
MKLSILKAIQIATTKKDFLIYTIENNEVKDFFLTNDLTRHRKKFGKESRFLLTEIAKQQLEFLIIKL